MVFCCAEAGKRLETSLVENTECEKWVPDAKHLQRAGFPKYSLKSDRECPLSSGSRLEGLTYTKVICRSNTNDSEYSHIHSRALVVGMLLFTATSEREGNPG